MCPHEDGADCDGDGYTVPDDCYDHDPDIHPYAEDAGHRFSTEPGVDEDCNGVDGPFTLTVGYGLHFQDVPGLDYDGAREFMSAYAEPVERNTRQASLYLSSDFLQPAASIEDITTLVFDSYQYAGSEYTNPWFSVGSTLADLDDDGNRELGVVCTSPDLQVSLCIFSGHSLLMTTGTIQPDFIIPGLEKFDIPFRVLGDLRGDGTEQVVIGNEPAYLYDAAAFGSPDFSWADFETSLELGYPDIHGSPDYNEGRMNFGLRQADMDGDGLDELFTSTRFYKGTDLSQPGAYTAADAWQAGDLSPSTAACTLKPAGDVSGDGATDLLFNCAAQGEFGAVWVATFEPAAATPAVMFAQVEGTADFPLGPISGSVGDADDDGFADIGIGGPDPEGSTAVLSNGLTIVRGDSLVGTVYLDVTMRAVAEPDIYDINDVDFDGDGSTDLMVRSWRNVGVVAHDDILP